MDRVKQSSIGGSLLVSSPPDAVFDVLADERNEPLYNRRLRDVRLLTPGPVGKGSVFAAQATTRYSSTPLVIEFTEFDRPRRLASSTRAPSMDVEGSVTLEPHGHGTMVRWQWALWPRGWLAHTGPLLTHFGVLSERRTWRGLKRYLENHVSEQGESEDRPPLPRTAALAAVARCFATSLCLLVHRKVAFPGGRVGLQIGFEDGTNARVYRDTVIAGRQAGAKHCVLAVCFHLKWVGGRGHRAFESESLLNTPLFVGFPGFVSKLWLAADESGTYRGLYEWEDPSSAEAYARALWRVLALVSIPGSIHYRVMPDLRRNEVLACPALLDRFSPNQTAAWWRVTSITE